MDNLLYSKRKKLMERGNQPEVYQYEQLPIEFRTQVVHIWGSAIPVRVGLSGDKWWDDMHNYFIRELGVFHLGPYEQVGPLNQFINFLLDGETPIDNILDLIELTFQCIDIDIREILNKYTFNQSPVTQLPDDAINELNHRFREHAIGYQYSNCQIIRVDSGFIHAEVVIPALSLLSSQDFSGAEQEFLLAHEHYRKQKYKEAITNALKAFESTMKTICSKCEWTYDKKACANELIKIIFQKQLLPEYLQEQFSNLKSILKSGIPTIRNITSGHGQGEQPTVVPEYLTAYVLHLTASNIVFLMEAYKSHKSISK
jgi:AbiJ N-terminal domain 4